MTREKNSSFNFDDMKRENNQTGEFVGQLPFDSGTEFEGWTYQNGYWKRIVENVEFTIEYRFDFRIISAWTVTLRKIESRTTRSIYHRDMFNEANQFIEDVMERRKTRGNR